MKKINDKQVMSICTSVAVITGAAVMGGITGYHQSDATFEELNAKSDLEKERAKQHKNFWNAMRIAVDLTAVCAGYSAGLLVKDAFGLGKK